MKVSVITVCFNAAQTIEQTVESVLDQKEIELEYIIVDGASQDETLQLIKPYQRKIAHIVSEKDTGMYQAINKGLELATGDIIAILNADDFYASPFVLSDVVELMFQQNVDAVYGDLQYVERHNPTKVIRFWKSGEYNRKKFTRGWMPPHPAFFCKRECYSRFGNFNLDFSSAADYELMLRFLYVNQVSAAYLPKLCVKMRTGGKSNQTVSNRLVANREDVKAWRINGLTPPAGLAVLKPLRKIGQFIARPDPAEE